MEKIRLSYTDDRGYNWSNWDEQDIGDLGEYGMKVSYLRLGSFYERAYRIQVSSARRRDILGAVGFVEGTLA